MSDTLDESLPAHAPLGPSSAEGWSTCADYVRTNAGLPDTSTQAAAEGTFAHLVSDIALLSGLDAEDFLGFTLEVAGFQFAWEEDDAALLQIGLDRTRALGGQFHGELRVDTSQWTLPGQFGTLDRATICMIDGEWWIVIIDLKWGRGIAVSPIRNKQLVLYALAFWWSVARHVAPGVTRFKLMIDQPRHGGGGGEWNTTLDELLQIGAELRERAALTPEGGERTASLAGCMWCRRRRAPGGCDTFDAYMVALLGLDWSEIDMRIAMSMDFAPPRDLTPERRSWLLLHKNSVERWFDQMEAEAREDAERGADIGLQKLVQGNKLPDKWKEGAAVVVDKVVGDKGFNKRLKTPKQLGTVIAGNENLVQVIEPLIERGQKKLILVPLEDARPAVITGSAFDEDV